MTRPLLLLSLAFLLTLAAGAHSSPASSPWRFEFDGPGGLSIRYRGIPIIRQSSLYAVKPGWTGLVYDQRSERQVVERAGGGLRVVGENRDFRAEYRIDALDERRIRLTFDGRLLRDVPANLEYGIGYVNADLVANRPFLAETASGARSGIVPAWPASEVQEQNELAPGLRSIEFESRIGKLRIEAAAPQPLRCFDARRDPQDWAKRAPVLWLGMAAAPGNLRFGAPVHVELVIAVDPAPLPPPHSVAVRQPPVPVAAAQTPPAPRGWSVIPQPKQIHAAAGSFRLADGVRWTLSTPAVDRRLALQLRHLLRERLGLRPGRGRTLRSRSAWTEIYLRAPGVRMRRAAGHEAGDWSSNPEGYRLRAGADGIRISAPTPQGAFYGLQTLEQLVHGEADGYTCPGVVVEDWPSMRFRGAHWFPSASGVPFHRRLIERVMARYKLNRAVIQCEAARWSSHPEIAAPNSISKQDLRGLVALCRSSYIEPIPLVNCPGHGEWMFRNGQNLALAEDPQTPYAYCVSNPESSRFIRQILSEAIDVFHPRTFHLGHDEVTLKGRFPNPECPRCRSRSVTDLVLQNAHALHDWLGARGIRTMIWGDMFLAPAEVPDAGLAPSVPEAAARRAGVPKGTTIADWHYSGSREYPSLSLFQQQGLETVGCTWYEPLNIQRFSQSLLRAASPGLLQTTWCGYLPDESVLRHEARQFSAFILAAEYAWSGRADPPAALPYDAGTEFARAYRAESARRRPGALVDLAPAAKVPRHDWAGLGAGWDLGGLPSGDRNYGGVLFRVPREKMVVLDGVTVPGAARELVVALNTPAREVALLNAAASGGPNGVVVGRMTAQYTDGSSASMDMTTGETTAPWIGDGPALDAPIGWHAESPGHTSLALRVTRWQNPHPERRIAWLRLEPVDPEAGWIVAGLTLIR